MSGPVCLCRVWDTRTQQIAQTLLTEGTVLSLEAPQDGSSLFTAAHGNTVSFWDGNNFDKVGVTLALLCLVPHGAAPTLLR